MLLPSIFGENLFDDFFGDMSRPVQRARFQTPASGIMKTDIVEVDGGYELRIDLPGYSKDNVKAELKDGYLTVTASAKDEKEEKNSRYLRRERFYGASSRSFYVGEELDQEDIKARFCDGILTVSFPRKEPKEEIEQKKYIAIE